MQESTYVCMYVRTYVLHSQESNMVTLLVAYSLSKDSLLGTDAENTKATEAREWPSNSINHFLNLSSTGHFPHPLPHPLPQPLPQSAVSYLYLVPGWLHLLPQSVVTHALPQSVVAHHYHLWSSVAPHFDWPPVCLSLPLLLGAKPLFCIYDVGYSLW